MVKIELKRFVTATLVAVALAAPAFGATMPPPLPSLDVAQSSRLAEQMSRYKSEVDARVAQGEITATEAARLLAWREWQFAREIAGLAPPRLAYITPNYPPRPGETGVPPDYRPDPPTTYYYSVPYPVYTPWPAYPAPYAWYAAPWPSFVWGATICGGGWGHHFRIGGCL